jgi:hypothetical protein
MRAAEVTGVTLDRIPCTVEADRVTGGAQGGLSFPARAGLPRLVFPLLDPRLRGGDKQEHVIPAKAGIQGTAAGMPRGLHQGLVGGRGVVE